MPYTDLIIFQSRIDDTLRDLLILLRNMVVVLTGPRITLSVRTSCASYTLDLVTLLLSFKRWIRMACSGTNTLNDISLMRRLIRVFLKRSYDHHQLVFPIPSP